MELFNVNRRNFLKMTGISAGGLILGWSVPKFAIAATADNEHSLNAYLLISTDNTITLFSPNPEIGQGVKTALPMIIAEELEADWQAVVVKQSTIDSKLYKRQAAGGSRSVNVSWDKLRYAGASAKLMLIKAASLEWQVAEAECFAENAHVIHKATQRKLSYGELAEKAALLDVPADKQVKLKSVNEYNLIGKRVGGVDNIAIVTGQPLFGIDQQIPNMLYATYAKCPAYNGKPISANLAEVKQQPGVIDVFIIKGSRSPRQLPHGVAIVGTSTWAVFKAKQILKVKWDTKKAAKDSLTQLQAQAGKFALHDKGDQALLTQGDVKQGFKQAEQTVSSLYTYPYLAHTPLEPMNASAWYTGDALHIWAPAQIPQGGKSLAAKYCKLDESKVVFHQTRVGGGFGRRLANDYVMEAVAISKQIKQPVQYVSTREEDTTHDHYRPSAFFKMKAGIDKQGKISAWQEHFITLGGNKKAGGPAGRILPEFPAPLLSNFELTQSLVKSRMPIGAMRAPISNGVAFPLQSFLHEISTAAKRDHLEFLLEILGEPVWLKPNNKDSLHTGRAAEVLKLAATKAGWGKPLAKGQGMGIAFYFSHSTPVAQVVELSVDSNKKIKLHKITVAADAGPIVNLSGAEHQCQGSVIDGISIAMGQEITFTNGVVEQTNFDDYPLQRINGIPEIEVHFIQSDFQPTGLGEPALPPTAPALCNAIAAATGERVYQLPLNKSGFSL